MALVLIQQRRDTAANWTAANPVLQSGEIGFETDTDRLKVGDGVRSWSLLPYVNATAFVATSAPPAVGSASVGTSSLLARADHSHALPSALTASTVAASGNVTIGGTLTVTGSLTGGAHTQTASTITDFDEAVDDRVSTLVVAGSGISKTYDDVNGTLTIAVGAHSHVIADVTGLQAALDAKAGTTHSHAISDVTNLQSSLDLCAKSNASLVANSTAITNIVAMTQAAYNLLSTKSSTTLYVIT